MPIDLRFDGGVYITMSDVDLSSLYTSYCKDLFTIEQVSQLLKYVASRVCLEDAVWARSEFPSLTNDQPDILPELM